MKQPNQCKQLKKQYAELTELKDKFGIEYEKAKKTGNTRKAKEFRAKIEEKMSEIQENLNPFEKELKIREQYELQRDLLEKAGILQKLESGKTGIVGIDGKEYPYPEYREISKAMRENREIIEKKKEQGFVEIQITPFLPVEALVPKLEEALLKHHKEGKLLAAKKDPGDPDEPIGLNKENPVWAWKEWTEKNTVYFPQQLSEESHGGKTMREILDEQKKENSPFAGYLVSMIESSPNIPRENKGKTIAGRKQIEANKTPKDYMGMLKNDPQYKNERPKALQEWITRFLIHLEQKNEIIDDYSGNGSAGFCQGSFVPSSRSAGVACWYRNDQVAYMGRDGPRFRSHVVGLASAVGLNVLKFGF